MDPHVIVLQTLALFGTDNSKCRDKKNEGNDGFLEEPNNRKYEKCCWMSHRKVQQI
jgi:hypothetical protein